MNLSLRVGVAPLAQQVHRRGAGELGDRLVDHRVVDRDHRLPRHHLGVLLPQVELAVAAELEAHPQIGDRAVPFVAEDRLADPLRRELRLEAVHLVDAAHQLLARREASSEPTLSLPPGVRQEEGQLALLDVPGDLGRSLGQRVVRRALQPDRLVRIDDLEFEHRLRPTVGVLFQPLEELVLEEPLPPAAAEVVGEAEEVDVDDRRRGRVVVASGRVARDLPVVARGDHVAQQDLRVGELPLERFEQFGGQVQLHPSLQVAGRRHLAGDLHLRDEPLLPRSGFGVRRTLRLRGEARRNLRARFLRHECGHRHHRHLLGIEAVARDQPAQVLRELLGKLPVLFPQLRAQLLQLLLRRIVAEVRGDQQPRARFDRILLPPLPGAKAHADRPHTVGVAGDGGEHEEVGAHRLILRHSLTVVVQLTEGEEGGDPPLQRGQGVEAHRLL